MNPDFFAQSSAHPSGEIATAWLTGFPAPLAALLLIAGGGHAASSCLARSAGKPIIQAVQLWFLG